jgi:Phage integrase, N-terminal SAM-like domain
MKLLDRVRHAIRVKHFSYRTEQAYVYWIERFIRYHNIRHPDTMAAPEILRLGAMNGGARVNPP